MKGATPRIVGAGLVCDTAVCWAWDTGDEWWPVVEWSDEIVVVDRDGARWVILPEGVERLRPVTDAEWCDLARMVRNDG